MRKNIFTLPGRSGTMLFGMSPWLLVGVSVILGLAIMTLAVRNTERERRHTIQNLLGRADALIWALEAGTRTGMGIEGQKMQLQPLIEETARQPGVLYMAVIDVNGRIVAHSDPAKAGKTVGAGTLPSTPPDEATSCMLLERPETALFEVYRGYSPLLGGHVYSHGHGGHRMAEGFGERAPSAMAQARPTSYAFVGLDRKPFVDALAADRWNNLLSAGIVALFALGGFVSLFWAHSYKRSRRKLKDSQALASEVVTSLPLGLLTSDPQGRLRMANASALAMLRLDAESAKGALVSAIPGLDWEAVITVLKNREKVFEKEMALTLPGGKSTPVSVSASEIRDEDGLFLGHLFILRDLAEMKRLQKEVQRNERLTALGNLAAGVAHEIRNPLSSIKGLATFLAGKMQPGGREEEAARTMAVEVDRLNRVVSELLEFAKPSAVKLSEADINEVVSRALRLAGTDLASKNIRVDCTPAPALPRVFINPERLTQALLNLFLNAVQAMDAGGVLTVSVETRPGDEFAMVISDTGRGMDKETLASIFTPYFTTKGSGTGLGLAIVHEIVEGHGGTISVASTPGQGSTFTITLPLRNTQ